MMCGKVVLLVLVVSVCLVAGDRSPGDYQSSFTQWMGRHNRFYSSDEFANRFQVFKSNLDFIDTHNARNLSYKVGLTPFADLTVEDFKVRYLSPIHRDLSHAQEFTGEGIKIARANLDWRTKGAVTAVKNQGQCGSCWTFASAGAIESTNQISTGNLVALSEQNLLDCVSVSMNCSTGGSFISAMQYVVNNGGIDTMASYPYTGTKSTTCKYNAANSAATLTGVFRVTANDESALLTAVTQQPVAVAIRGDLRTFQLYSSGTYSDTTCTADPNYLNHAVIAIGYGTDSSGDYWLIKNSWDTTWGIKGFAQMKRGSNICGIAAQAAFPSKASTRGWVFQDSLYTGWNIAYSGTVTGISSTNAGVTGVSVTATIGSSSTNSRLVFGSSPSYTTSGFTTLSFAVKTTSTGSLKYNIGSTSLTIGTSTSFQTINATLSSLGSVASVTYISFFNAGTATNTFSFDNIRFI